jgi:1-acyl-sn-glycerol-3-phosphate acyltransferase
VWETFALYAVLRDPIYVVKRELMWIPVFGWYAWKARNIPVNRNAGLAALARMTVLAQKELERPRQLVIFPEGTRRPPGAEPLYKPGVAYLYGKAGVACVPLALNSGLFWPRRSLRRFPGTILVEALNPIPPGVDRKAFFARLQSDLEDATARLIQESGIRNQGSGRKDEYSKEIGY